MLTYNKWREKYYSYSRMNSQKEIYFWGNLIPLSPIEIKWCAPNQGGGNGSVSLSALLMLATQNPNGGLNWVTPMRGEEMSIVKSYCTS